MATKSGIARPVATGVVVRNARDQELQSNSFTSPSSLLSSSSVPLPAPVLNGLLADRIDEVLFLVGPKEKTRQLRVSSPRYGKIIKQFKINKK